MPASIFRPDDVHIETTGPTTHGPVPHPFEAEPAATQNALCTDGQPLLREGDEFMHSGSSHRAPRTGTAFAKPKDVTGKGKFTDAGQHVVFLDGVAPMTMGGRLETCSDATRETTCDEAVLLADVPPLFIDGFSVLPGKG